MLSPALRGGAVTVRLAQVVRIGGAEWIAWHGSSVAGEQPV
jgi:hypothetical protein